MVLIRLLRDEAGRLAGFEARGHALFAEHGMDVVCAGVSALLQTTAMGLKACADARPSWRHANGQMRCRVPRARRDGETGELARVLLESMALGLREIDRAYPGTLLIVDAPVWDRRPRPRIESEAPST